MLDIDQLIQRTLAEVRKDFKGTDAEFDARVKENLKDIRVNAYRLFMSSLLELYEKGRLKQINKDLAAFRKKHQKLHHDGLDLLLIFIDLNITINNEMTDHFKVPEFPEPDKVKFVQLLLLHTKACQIINEVYTLVSSGYADAALARWRTLHETCVTFLCLYQSDTQTSQMYLDFQVVEKLKRAKLFNIHHETLKWKPIEAENVTALEKMSDKLHAAHGREFLKDYGWTINILQPGQRHFAGLETLSGLSYLRPFYQWANSKVHSGSEGIYDRLSFDSDDILDIPRSILAGPTKYGLVDPVQFSTYSMLEMTSALVELVNKPEPKLMLEILKMLHDEIATSLIESTNKLPK